MLACEHHMTIADTQKQFPTRSRLSFGFGLAGRLPSIANQALRLGPLLFSLDGQDQAMLPDLFLDWLDIA